MRGERGEGRGEGRGERGEGSDDRSFVRGTRRWQHYGGGTQ